MKTRKDEVKAAEILQTAPNSFTCRITQRSSPGRPSSEERNFEKEGNTRKGWDAVSRCGTYEAHM